MNVNDERLELYQQAERLVGRLELMQRTMRVGDTPAGWRLERIYARALRRARRRYLDLWQPRKGAA